MNRPPEKRGKIMVRTILMVIGAIVVILFILRALG